MSTIVIDTHVLIWDQLDPGKISAKARRQIQKADEEGSIIISEISLWEIASLMRKGRLVMEVSYLDFIKDLLLSRSYALQGIQPEIADLTNRIQLATKDPADHIIAATAIYVKAPLITADLHLRQSKDVLTYW